ncbi:unnamed protein product [Owenia fusiformis]|uniref:Uncharacterized protein n=1 Tax=Owenia fusiformis TaxID=6347 RepID=A0A8J1YBY2_OWEFU|nr:unnamed protein product [Owenia fusiformis]
MAHWSVWCFAIVLGVSVDGQGQANWNWDQKTSLDNYVYRDDPSYTFSLTETRRYDSNDDTIEDTTIYYLNMTSQTWKTNRESSRPVWVHQLMVTVPDNVNVFDTAFLFIGAGMNDEPELPDPETSNLLDGAARVSQRTQMVGAYLMQVPQQPVTLPKSSRPDLERVEDSIIAWTWREYIEGNATDPELLLYYPMVKASVRAMDTIANFTMTQDQRFNITKFFTAGASKRGWTTWLVAAVDQRVIGAVPQVFSVLKLVETVNYHYRAYGGWAWAFGPYWDENITQYLQDPRTQDMANLIDPYSYRSRLTVPMMIIQTTADEFFRPDEPGFWYHDLTQPKWIWMLVDSNHAMIGYWDEIFANMGNFFLGILQNYQLPSFSWTKETTATSASITMTTPTEPSAVRCWYGETADGPNGAVRRDFRWLVRGPEDGDIDINEVFWSEATPLNFQEVEEGRMWRCGFDAPEAGWLGFFIEMEYDFPGNDVPPEVLKFSTELHVTPNTWPFPQCGGPSECWGRIV